MNILSRFVRSVKNKDYEGESAATVEAAVRHYSDLKAKAKRMISQRGYQQVRAQYKPDMTEVGQQQLENLRSMFIEQSLDGRIEEALPIIARLTQPKEKPMRELEEFETWAESITEVTQAMPDTAIEMDQLQLLMSKELPVGPDATNAVEQLYDLISDDELFDQLSKLAQQDPSADARPVVVQRMKELGYQLNMPAVGEDIDIDGVMMTRSSGMSSESIERLKQLLRA
jgi:hypothetical protein